MKQWDGASPFHLLNVETMRGLAGTEDGWAPPHSQLESVSPVRRIFQLQLAESHTTPGLAAMTNSLVNNFGLSCRACRLQCFLPRQWCWRAQLAKRADRESSAATNNLCGAETKPRVTEAPWLMRLPPGQIFRLDCSFEAHVMGLWLALFLVAAQLAHVTHGAG